MQITGRITADAKVRTLKDDRQVVNFTLAVNDGYRNRQTGDWVDLTEYYRCAYWLAPKVAKSLTKGRLVQLTGRASASAWTASDGTLKADLNFHTSDIRFYDGAGKRQEAETVQDGTESIDDDLPF